MHASVKKSRYQFPFRQEVLNFGSKLVLTGYFRSQTEKNENPHLLEHSRISQSTKFQVRLKISIFGTKFTLKEYFMSRAEK